MVVSVHVLYNKLSLKSQAAGHILCRRLDMCHMPSLPIMPGEDVNNVDLLLESHGKKTISSWTMAIIIYDLVTTSNDLGQ